MAISEFGLSMLMLILLNHYMFIEVMRYLHDNKAGLEANKIHFVTHCFVSKAKWAFLITLCYNVLFYDVNLTISPLDRAIIAKFTKGFSMKTLLINILCL